ncbi:MTH1187 family thiamine-binding protein [Streptomyces afghaniensis]|uniref:MTH1187 family thiamine-binding protein n=1 Tax=Streptomyces afghaniensis TaxID=66865 RepID=UPI0037D6CA2C
MALPLPRGVGRRTDSGAGRLERQLIRHARRPCTQAYACSGEWDEVMDVIRRAVAAVERRAPRVSLVLKADIRPGVTDGLTSKVETVERHLAE